MQKRDPLYCCPVAGQGWTATPGSTTIAKDQDQAWWGGQVSPGQNFTAFGGQGDGCTEVLCQSNTLIKLCSQVCLLTR